jgi:purine-binding chemotaxis protein CheW
MAMFSPTDSAIPASRPADLAPGDVVLICRARSWFCALPVGFVEETMRPLPLGPLATAAVFVRGLSIIRGVPTPVVDLGALLGADEAPRPRRLVLLRLEGRRVALSVEGVLGVRAIAGASLRELPPLLRDASRQAVSAVGALDDALLLALDAARLVPEAVWDHLAGADAGQREGP